MENKPLVFPDKKTWLAERQKRIGGSECASLFHVQPDYAPSLYALWQIKSGRIPAPDVGGDRPMWGMKLEEVIGAATAEEKGWKVKKGAYIPHPTIPGMGATLDFLAEFPDGTEGPLETKNADWLIHRRQWGDEPPPHILLQLMHQCACLQAKRGAVACLVGGNHLDVYEYEARPKLIAEIEKKVRDFWRSIEEGREPPIDGSDSTAAAIKAQFAEVRRPEPLDLTTDNALPELCASFLQAASIRKQAEKDEQAARNGILAKLGEHGEAFCAGFRVNAPAIAGSPDRVIHSDDIGKIIKGRVGYRRVAVKESHA